MHIRGPPLLAASLLAIVTISPLLIVPTSKAEEMDKSHNQITSTVPISDEPGIEDKNQQQLSRSLEYPRQLFRLHILDSRPSSRSRQVGSVSSYYQTSNNNEYKQANKPKLSKNISNATLKKLLSQAIQQQHNRLPNLTLIGAPRQPIFITKLKPQSQTITSSSQQANSIDSSDSNRLDTHGRTGSGSSILKKPSSNFKFVFIHRAAAPLGNFNSNITLNNRTKSSSTNKHGATDNYNSNRQTNVSLAASISKQLASSLMYSAASLISNLNLTSSQTPSLTELKTQLTKSNSTETDSDTAANDESSNDIQRLNRKKGKLPLDDRSDHPHTATSPMSSATTKKPKFRKNSKIYNLPVKFVSNGQPTQIVIQTIKQHMAAIRRMQQISSSPSTIIPDQGVVRHANNRTDSSSTSPFNTKTKKVKGTNSRLIYLPLKLLINGKPSRISLSNRMSNSNGHEEMTLLRSSDQKKHHDTDDPSSLKAD